MIARKNILWNTSGGLQSGRWAFIAFGAFVWLASVLVLCAADTHYVNKANGAPVSPFTNGWASAATQIQDAVNASANGDIVLVTNGIYNTGGTNAYVLTNRVCINNKAITLMAVSTNPADTLIVGAVDSGTGSNGPAAIRGVGIFGYISSSVSGFTITNGYTYPAAASENDKYGGGVFVQYHRPPNGYGSYFTNCVIVGCWALSGGGVYAGNYVNCSMINNIARANGGGALGSFSVFSNCVFSGNISDPGKAGYGGGGVSGGDVYNSVIVSNSSFNGGGLSGASAYNCTIRDNSASGNAPYYGGGGFSGGTLAQNCLIMGNSSLSSRGAANGATPKFINCTIGSNISGAGFGTLGDNWGAPVLTNCIIYGNAPYNLEPSRTYVMSYSCVVTAGVACTINGNNNTTNNPLFANPANGNYRLTSGSPCVNTGTNLNWTSSDVDLEGRTRIQYGTVDMGCYEWLAQGMVFRGF